MGNIDSVDKQFSYMRRRNPKGELTLEFHNMNEAEAEILRGRGYKVIKKKKGFLNKDSYYEVTQYPEV